MCAQQSCTYLESKTSAEVQTNSILLVFVLTISLICNRQILANRATLASLLQNVSLAVSDAESVYDKQLQLILHDLKEGQEITQHMNIVGSVNPLNESAYAPKGSKSYPQPTAHVILVLLH